MTWLNYTSDPSQKNMNGTGWQVDVLPECIDRVNHLPWYSVLISTHLITTSLMTGNTSFILLNPQENNI